jgi:hypothetical protein
MPMEREDLFELAHLYPATGLPMKVWVSARGNARRNVRVTATVTDGDQTNIANIAVVRVRPIPRVVEGQLLQPVRHRRKPYFFG